MSHIHFSSPFLKHFTHLQGADQLIDSTPVTILAAADVPERRVVVIIQNKSLTASIQVIFASTGNTGFFLPPLGNISLDNYNGIIRAVASAAATQVHVAYATA